MREIFTRQERLFLTCAAGVTLLGLAILGWQGGVPRFPVPLERTGVGNSQNDIRLQVRINTASASELSALPGIGPAMARRIVSDREDHGRYLTLMDLKRVQGVGPKTLEQIRRFLRFD